MIVVVAVWMKADCNGTACPEIRHRWVGEWSFYQGASNSKQ
jgi:hypothetical protein